MKMHALLGFAFAGLLAAQASAAPILSLSDTVGDPSSVTVLQGTSFSVNVTIASPDVAMVGMSFFANISPEASGKVSLTGGTTNPSSPFQDLNTSGGLAGAAGTLSPTLGSDLGYTTFPAAAAGTYQLSTLNFSVSPSLALGIYTLKLTNASGTGPGLFDELGIADSAGYTVNVTAVPEPVGLATLAATASLALRRRKRT